MTYQEGRVGALNRARARLDERLAELSSFSIFSYRLQPAGPRGAFAVYDGHWRHVGRFTPDGQFRRSTVKGSEKLLPGFAAALRMLAAQIDDAEADNVPLVAFD
jgi:hypothetical protein